MRQVVWSQSAQDDYLEILQHIVVDDPFAADKVVDAIAKAGEGLGDFATGHPGRVTGTYEKTVAGMPYIIAYSLVDGDQTVAILRVIHAARDWNEDQWPE
jgi:toxin ParE1/3/4